MRAEDVDRFLAAHPLPIVDGRACAFFYRGAADEVRLVQRITGQTGRVPMRRIAGTDLWYAVLDVPEGSRLNYQFEVRRGDHVECVNDPLNPLRSRSPVGDSSVLHAHGYETPQWTVPSSEAPPGELRELVVPSRALDRDCEVTLYVPAAASGAALPLLVVHDGRDFLTYSAAQAVLDNLIHRGEVAPVAVAFVNPKDREAEYADSQAHAAFLRDELVPYLSTTARLRGRPSLLGSSFGAIASLAAAYRSPATYRSLILLSGSFVFTDGVGDHGGGPAFDPVVAFVNRYRRQPRRVADRMYVSCGVYEPLIAGNRAMLPVFQGTGMEVRYAEAPDGHTWENWRDRLRDALSWSFPGPGR
jgi:enterochelin esterase-like enzyme